MFSVLKSTHPEPRGHLVGAGRRSRMWHRGVMPESEIHVAIVADLQSATVKTDNCHNNLPRNHHFVLSLKCPFLKYSFIDMNF